MLGQHRSTQREVARASDEAALIEDLIAGVKPYGRYGYRRVTLLLRNKLVREPQAVWRASADECLYVPQKQPKPARL